MRVMLWCTVCAWREERRRDWTLCENRRERAAERRARVWRVSVGVVALVRVAAGGDRVASGWGAGRVNE